ncbi:MAG: hypothetical protein NTV49_07000 [Kiritimatiellaeota bacterium]|nr:hypothetical protein [Kiritimatiellota bacterium]
MQTPHLSHRLLVSLSVLIFATVGFAQEAPKPTGKINSIRFAKWAKPGKLASYYSHWSASVTVKVIAKRSRSPEIRMTYLVESDKGKLRKDNAGGALVKDAAYNAIDSKNIPQMIQTEFCGGSLMGGETPSSAKILAFRAELLLNGEVLDVLVQQNDKTLEAKGIPADWWEEKKHPGAF